MKWGFFWYLDMGIEFSIDFDDEVQLNGIIDLFLYNDNDIKLFDYKSTKNPVRFYFVEWDDDIQKLMYEFYIYKTYSKMPHSFNYVVLNYNNRTVFLKNYNTVIKEDFNSEQYFRNLSHIISEIKNLYQDCGAFSVIRKKDDI